MQGVAYYSARTAITEVLTRLPAEAFDSATEEVMFIIQRPDTGALNVPIREELYVIVLFERCLKLSPSALIAVVATKSRIPSSKATITTLTKKWQTIWSKNGALVRNWRP
jgi:hypothetical protein